MGSEEFYPEERPVHEVRVDGFWMDRCTVTNEEFERFVTATGYQTVAERPLQPEDFPGVPPEKLVPGALVFHKTAGPVDLKDYRNWWAWTPGASWRNPYGPGSSIHGIEKHPVVHIAFGDAQVYAKWAEKKLPTEAEWEFAARGGLEGAKFTWGDEHFPDGRAMANSWQGEFPWQNSLLDGYEGTAPVGSFPPNGYGLFDMAGNVWEWDLGLVCVPACGRTRQILLRPPSKSANRLPGQKLRPGPAGRPCSPQGCEGRLVPVCA